MLNDHRLPGKKIILTCFLSMMIFSCKKLVDVPTPYTSTSANNVFASDATASSVLTGIYGQLSNASYTSSGIQTVGLFGGLSADELTLYRGVNVSTYIACYQNAQIAKNPIDLWSGIYPFVYQANAAVEGVAASNSLSAPVKQQLLGEGKFLRAFFYFYLVNFYGDVPLILSTDYNKTAIVPRTAKNLVYQQIISDLKDAQSLLNPNYVDATLVTSTKERTRPNKSTAAALLARVYLYYAALGNTGYYAKADSAASAVINNTSLYSLTPLDGVFLKNSAEAIWQWQPTTTGFNTQDAKLYVIPPTGPTTNQVHPVYLSSDLLSNFEPGDLRLQHWVGSITVSGTTYHYPFKYKINTFNSAVTSVSGLTEYTMILRLAEQYLIRAEARCQQGNILGNSGALADVNVIRSRAGLGPYAGPTDQASVLNEILHEKRVELFAEWGHRWLDLKRTGQVNSVMGIITPGKGGSWNPDWALYPINQTQIQANPDLVQNPGY